MNEEIVGRQQSRCAVVYALCMTFIAAIYPPHALPQSELPADVRADILQRKIFDAARANDLPTALSEIDEYKSLRVPIPPTLLLVEAKAANRTGDPLRAFNALKAFLAVGQRGSKGYDEALALYSPFEKEAAPAMEKAEEAKQIAEVQRREAEIEQQSRRNAAVAAKEQAEALQREKEEPRFIHAFIEEIESNLVSIPESSFRMGHDAAVVDYENGNWQPSHPVRLRAFLVSSRPISTYEFWQFLILSRRQVATKYSDDFITLQGGKTIYSDNGTGLPAKADWEAASSFVTWLSGVSGRRFRLLSEAEWEFLARNWKSTYNVHGRFKLDFNIGEILKKDFRTNWSEGEWVSDCWHDSYVGAPSDGKPWLVDGDCKSHVVRGTASVAMSSGSFSTTRDDTIAVAGRVRHSLGNAVFRIAVDQ